VSHPVAGSTGWDFYCPEAQRIIDEMEQMSTKKYVAFLTIALAYGDLGEKDQAFAWLDKAYDDHSEYLLWLNYDPSFESVRSDPRFQDLARKVGAQVQ
jgi:hypothetical protein